MARIIGCVTTSHVPAIGRAIEKGQQEEPYWKPFFDGFKPVHEWLREAQPDVAVIIYNDHGLNFFLDKLPTFAIGAAPEYRSADEGWNIPTVLPFAGDPGLSWHIINSVVAEDFDITTCQEEMVVDHAVCNPMALLWPGGEPWPVRIVPVEINTIQFPLPSAARCYHLGEAIGRAIASYPEDLRVLVMGTGGLSHQLDGERAGFINTGCSWTTPRACTGRTHDANSARWNWCLRHQAPRRPGEHRRRDGHGPGQPQAGAGRGRGAEVRRRVRQHGSGRGPGPRRRGRRHLVHADSAPRAAGHRRDARRQAG
jgi:protocatechuate 4,5-dioxygenase beta chain